MSRGPTYFFRTFFRCFRYDFVQIPLDLLFLCLKTTDSSTKKVSRCFQPFLGAGPGGRTRTDGLMGPVRMPPLPAILVSEAGVEPAKPASLAQYLCQFGYTDILKQAVFLLSGGLFKNSLFQMRILRLNAISHWRPQGELNPCLRRDKPA